MKTRPHLHEFLFCATTLTALVGASGCGVEVASDGADETDTTDMGEGNTSPLANDDCQRGQCINNGATCTMPSDCGTGFCVDGVCCDTGCTGLCQSCSAAKKGSGADGTCGNIDLGLDPDNECVMNACNGSGACANACNGTVGLPGTPLLQSIEVSQSSWTPWYHWSVDAADFDGDGIQDIAVVGGARTESTSRVEVYKGQGDGTFGAPTTIASPLYARAVVTKDLNADGFPDVVAASVDAGGVTVMLNDGQGGFGPPVGYNTGMVGSVSTPRPDMLRVADINGDGIVDLLTANESANTVTLLLGQGDGTFPTKVDVTTLAKPIAIAVADFNADGTLDLAVTNYDAATTKDRVSIMMGLGGGSFGAAVHYVIAKQSRSLATADLNGDGKPDLISANYNAGSGQKIFVLLSQGNGTFTNPVGYAVGSVARVVPTDMNGDAIVDLVVAGYETRTVEVLRGQGNGTFAATVPYSAQGYSYGIAVVDLDNDNDKDIVSADRHRLTVLENSGTGSLGTTIHSAPSIFLPSSKLRSADINADGMMDLVGVADSGVNVVFGQSNGGFGPMISTPLLQINGMPNSLEVREAALGDVNGDGKPDLISRRAEIGMIVQINQGNGTFSSPKSYNVPHYSFAPSWLVLGDFNNDGFVDVAMSSNYAYEIVPYHRWRAKIVVNVWYGNSNGTLAQPQEQVFTQWEFDCAYCSPPALGGNSMTGADFNGDGLMDLAIYDGSWGGTYTALNQGNGQFLRDSGPIGGVAGWLYGVDLSGNGLADLIVADGNGSHQWHNMGGGSFVNVGNFWESVSELIPVDLDNNGVKDLALIAGGTNSARVVLQQANGSVGNILDYAAGFDPGSIAAGDWNHDGKMDLAVQNKAPYVSILYNTCQP